VRSTNDRRLALSHLSAAILADVPPVGAAVPSPRLIGHSGLTIVYRIQAGCRLNSGPWPGNPSHVPLDDAEQNGKEGKYTNQSEDERNANDRRAQSALLHAGDRKVVLAPQITDCPLVFPYGNHACCDTAENQGKAEISRCFGKASRTGRRHLLHAVEELNDGETEADERCGGANPRHHRAFDGEPGAQPGKMTLGRDANRETAGFPAALFVTHRLFHWLSGELSCIRYACLWQSVARLACQFVRRSSSADNIFQTKQVLQN